MGNNSNRGHPLQTLVAVMNQDSQGKSGQSVCLSLTSVLLVSSAWSLKNPSTLTTEILLEV